MDIVWSKDGDSVTITYDGLMFVVSYTPKRIVRIKQIYPADGEVLNYKYVDVRSNPSLHQLLVDKLKRRTLLGLFGALSAIKNSHQLFQHGGLLKPGTSDLAAAVHATLRCIKLESPKFNNTK